MSTLPNLKDYECFSQFRKHKKGGGCCIFVRNDLNYKYREDLSYFHEGKLECVFIEITPKTGKHLIVGTVYRPPKATYEDSVIALENIIIRATNKGQKIYINGDLNYNILNEDHDRQTFDFLSMLTSYGISPVINTPTRITTNSETCIDNVFSNQPSEIILSASLAADVESDHLPVISVSQKLLDKQCESYSFYRDYSENNKARFRARLQKADFSPVFNELEPNKIIEAFDKIFNNEYYECFPKKRRKNTSIKTNKPWIKGDLLNLRNEKESAFRKKIIEPSVENEENYKTLRNNFNCNSKKAEREFNQSRLENATNSKDKWKILNEISNRNSNTKDDIFILHGHSPESPIIDPKDIANEFNEYFTNIGPDLAAKIEPSNTSPFDYLTNSVQNSFRFEQITDIDITKIIDKCFSTSKAPGIDEIDGKIIKENSDILSLPISYAINRSLNTGIFPDKLKIACIKPIYKKDSDDKSEKSNYRPISLLPALSKIYEKVIVSQLLDFFYVNHVFSDSQFGFRNKHSTSHAIIDLLNIIADAIENGDYTAAIFLDLKKAFDTVDHKILLKKLEHYGIKGTPLHLIKSYLSNRKQFVKIQNILSDYENVICGIPQGSILGPLLFILYINDLSQISNSVHFILFADDSNVVKTGPNLQQLSENLENEFSLISKWLQANKLSLSLHKTKSMVFCTSQKEKSPEINIKLNDTNIEQFKETKFLGIHINEHLNWAKHIKHVTTKLSQVSGIIYRCRTSLPEDYLLQLYNSLALPHLIYCNPVWGNAPDSHLDPLIKMQKRIVRNVTNSKFLAHTSPLFKDLSLLKIPDINTHETLKLIHKYDNDELPQSLLNQTMKVNEVHNYNTKHNQDYRLKKYTTNIAARTDVINFGMSLWNSLEPSIRSQKFPSFSDKVKNDLIQNY